MSVWQHAVLFRLSTTAILSTAAKMALSLVQKLSACSYRLEVQIKESLALQAAPYPCRHLRCTAQVIKNNVFGFKRVTALSSHLLRHCDCPGHTESDLPNGRHMNGVTLNGSLQSGTDPDSDSDDFGEEPAAEVDGEPGAECSIEHRHTQASGAPQPLEPELVTLSLLPRSQWQSLVHLDAIKVGLLAAASCPSCASLAVSSFEMADTA